MHSINVRYPRIRTILLVFTILLGSMLSLSACGESSSSTTAPPTQPANALPTTQPATSETPVEPTPDSNWNGIAIIAHGESQHISPYLLGTNVPAWLGPDRLSDPLFRQRAQVSEASLIRLPGGSWSNAYNWLACETGDEENCNWPWAARPTDFINFLRTTGQEAMWTVSANGTPQEAAALVAFFNGDVNDEQPIGVDVRGRDWETVGYWAQLRSENGNPKPLNIRLWEIGNEIYGGSEGSGKDCTPWGWEDVWTCDGIEYVQGATVNGQQYEGFLAFLTEMKAVDPDILIGAVGVAPTADWSDWGNEVIAGAGAEMDFYSIHHYAYAETPEDLADTLAQPQQTWPDLVADMNTAFDQYAQGRGIPIAVTEYNIVAFQDLDANQYMRRAVSALFIADSIGQMAQQGVSIANQWDLANGAADNGTDYGLIQADTFDRHPQYYAFVLWGRFGASMLPVSAPFPADTMLSAYAGRGDDNRITLLVINKTSQPVAAPIRIDGDDTERYAYADVVSAERLDSLNVTFNGLLKPPDDLQNVPSQPFGQVTQQFEFTFEPFSITLIRLCETDCRNVPSANTQ